MFTAVPSPRLSPDDLIEALRGLADAGYMETWPAISHDETIESDAADFIERATALLREIAESGGPFAERARALLDG
jgi:hypothetical protein